MVFGRETKKKKKKKNVYRHHHHHHHHHNTSNISNNFWIVQIAPEPIVLTKWNDFDWSWDDHTIISHIRHSKILRRI